MMAADKNEHVSHTLGRMFSKFSFVFEGYESSKLHYDYPWGNVVEIVSSNVRQHVQSRINIFAHTA